MEQFIGCDAHKKFSVFVAVNEKGQAGEAVRVEHERHVYREFLARLPEHSAIAVEASGGHSWLVDEMEQLGHHPRLTNPIEAKRRMGLTNKTDKLDARGLASGFPVIGRSQRKPGDIRQSCWITTRFFSARLPISAPITRCSRMSSTSRPPSIRRPNSSPTSC